MASLARALLCNRGEVQAMRSRIGAAGLVVALAAVLVGGCTGPHQATGGVGGAATGGLIGGALAGPRGLIAGALLGGLFGSAVGSALDQRDRELAEAQAAWSLEHAPPGETSSWVNPESGHRGTITPLGPPEPASGPQLGEYCREFQQTVIVGGEEQEAYGTACRQPDGSWQIQ